MPRRARRPRFWRTWAICSIGRSRIANGQQEWHDSEPLAWDQEVARFFAALAAFDAALASDAPLAVSAEQLFQGPIADALTHVGPDRHAAPHGGL